MAVLSETNIITEFEEFDVPLNCGSPLLDKLIEIGNQHRFDAEKLCNEWIAFSKRNECELEPSSLEKWESHLSRRRTPVSRSAASKKKGTSTARYGGMTTYSEENLDSLFNINDDDKLIGTYGTPQVKEKMGQKRAGETTPTNTTPVSKFSRPLHNGSTPATPRGYHPVANGNTPNSENGMLSFQQRTNSGHVMCSLNDSLLPEKWAGSRAEIRLQHYDTDTALSSPYQYMFQKVSEKSLVLMERIRELGEAICHHNSLPSPLSVAQPSLEPAVFTGKVVCEGEGHLNAHSCLLEGPSHFHQNKGACVRMEIPDSVSCSLFPGQVVAVEGINNYNGVLIPSKIHDEGVLPPLPRRTVRDQSSPSHRIDFTLLCAAGPFSTVDNLAFDPLQDLLSIVRKERPDILLLMGPFLDSTHPQVKSCDIPGDMTFEAFFTRKIQDIYKSTKSSGTKLVLIPSQRDVHHPWAVYPQPPFQQRVHKGKGEWPRDIFSASDPSTLDMNGVCVGVTSTDILFHLSARAMFRGLSGDRMSRVVRHILQQQCYYPLLPSFRREDSSIKTQAPQTPGSEVKTPQTPESQQKTPKTPGPEGVDVPIKLVEEASEVNLDLVHMFDYKHACLPARPDLLILPSNLKPFAKIIDGCVCVNPGHLTKKSSGGTFTKIILSNQYQMKTDFSLDIGVQIVHI